MNDHSETVLDYTRIQRDLQDATVTPMGRDLAAQLHPIADVATLTMQQRETSEMVEQLAIDDAPPVSTVADLQPYLETTSIDGFYLDTSQLLDIATCLESVQRLRRYAQDATHQRLLVTRRLNRLSDFGILLREIRSAIDEQGHVRDHASAALMQTRQALRRMRERIQRRLQEWLSVYREVVQDAIITIRNDRFVIPLKADFPRALRGYCARGVVERGDGLCRARSDRDAQQPTAARAGGGGTGDSRGIARAHESGGRSAGGIGPSPADHWRRRSDRGEGALELPHARGDAAVCLGAAIVLAGRAPSVDCRPRADRCQPRPRRPHACHHRA